VKIHCLKGWQNVYTSNAYLITGDWNAIEDVNTLIDVGADPSIVQVLDGIYTGVGKKKVDQVILTHTHSDHTAILPLIREHFKPVICAYCAYAEGIDRVLKDGEFIRVGDAVFEVIHMPGHTDDSILLLDKKSGTLFVGDSPVIVRTPGGNYSEGFVQVLNKLCRKHVHAIYFGHGDPLVENVQQTLRHSLENVLKRG